MSDGDYYKLLLSVFATAFFFFLAKVLAPRCNPPLWRLNYTTLRAEPTQTCGAVEKTCQQEIQDVTATGTLRIVGLEETCTVR